MDLSKAIYTPRAKNLKSKVEHCSVESRGSRDSLGESDLLLSLSYLLKALAPRSQYSFLLFLPSFRVTLAASTWLTPSNMPAIHSPGSLPFPPPVTLTSAPLHLPTSAAPMLNLATTSVFTVDCFSSKASSLQLHRDP